LHLMYLPPFFTVSKTAPANSGAILTVVSIL
jgi:hypothetical protein